MQFWASEVFHLKSTYLLNNNNNNNNKKLRGLSPRANYTDRAAAAGRRS